VEHVPGDAARAFGLAEVRAKFRHFVALVLGDEMAGQLADLALAALDDGGSARLLLQTIEQGSAGRIGVT